MSIDSALFLSINGSAASPHWLTVLAIFATRQLPLLIAGGAAGAFLTGDRQVARKVLQVLGAMALAWILARLTQHFVQIDRPFTLVLGVQLLPHASTHGFPSNHASGAFAFATAIALVTRKVHWALLALVAAGCIAWSRVYLGLHFPSDVLAGAVLGAFSAWLACKLWSTRLANTVRFKAPA